MGGGFNIGNPEEISILDLAHRVKALTNSTSDIVFIPYDEAYEAGFEDMPRRVPDLTRIQRLIGYAPTVGLDETLHRVIAQTLSGGSPALDQTLHRTLDRAVDRAVNPGGLCYRGVSHRASCRCRQNPPFTASTRPISNLSSSVRRSLSCRR